MAVMLFLLTWFYTAAGLDKYRNDILMSSFLGILSTTFFRAESVVVVCSVIHGDDLLE